MDLSFEYSKHSLLHTSKILQVVSLHMGDPLPLFFNNISSETNNVRFEEKMTLWYILISYLISNIKWDQTVLWIRLQLQIHYNLTCTNVCGTWEVILLILRRQFMIEYFFCKLKIVIYMFFYVLINSLLIKCLAHL